PHNLTLGASCTDLRLAMKCNNFAVRNSCQESTAARRMYCETTEIVYQQEALGFCDGWLPSCEEEENTEMDYTEQDTLNSEDTELSGDYPLDLTDCPVCPICPELTTTDQSIVETTSWLSFITDGYTTSDLPGTSSTTEFTTYLPNQAT
ncbi:hypothetical protein PFISCL1PPCAC_10847, partial [Pristionchus fissidentatus]